MNIDQMTHQIMELLTMITLIILALGTIAAVLNAVGFLPKCLKDFLEKNKANDIKELFYQLDITPNVYINNMKALTLAYLSNSNDITDDKAIVSEINELVKKRTFKENMAWGTKAASYKIKSYIDLQGLTFIPEVNKRMAGFIEKLINNRIKSLIDSKAALTFDCIAVHENAAPFLGYEVSARMKLPLIFIKNEDWNKFPGIILHGQEVSKDRKSFLHAGQNLKHAIFIADFLMLGPHLNESKEYLARFGVDLTEVFLLVYKDIDNSREKIHSGGFKLNYWVYLHE